MLIPLCRPIIKSLKNIAVKGARIANSLLSRRAPANTAMPSKGVKFGGCGINLLKAKTVISINTVEVLIPILLISFRTYRIQT